MKPAYPVVISNSGEITGHVRPMALANAIHSRFPSSWGGAFFITLNNIRDCIEAGDRWFEEETPEGFRISTDSGFSCIVRDRLAFCSVPHALADLVTGREDGDQPASEPPPFAVTVTADNGDIYEATRASKNEAWTITYPEGQDRFAGTEAELRAHIKRLISRGPAAKNAP